MLYTNIVYHKNFHKIIIFLITSEYIKFQPRIRYLISYPYELIKLYKLINKFNYNLYIIRVLGINLAFNFVKYCLRIHNDWLVGDFNLKLVTIFYFLFVNSFSLSSL